MVRPTASARLTVWWLAYVAFVVYGSLVPLDYRPLPWDQAWSLFQDIRMLNVGAGGRADWVANGVLYVPVGFFTASVFSGGRSRHLPALFAAIGFSWILAVGVEFLQLAFPPRTVSLNDLLAEFIGSGVGALMAGVASHRVQGFLASLAGKGESLVPRALAVYALGYCAFSLFPFDFLMSSAELSDKFHSVSWGWMVVDGGGGGRAAAVAKLMAEAFAAAPLGCLLVLRGLTVRRTLGAGVVLGVVIETAQFFLVSGVCQAISVLTRGLGVLAGAIAWEHRGNFDWLRLAAGIRRYGMVLMALYLLSIVAVTGWFEVPIRSTTAAFGALGEVRFLPFYYHYYTTEQAALLSLVSVALMYAPLGVLAWAYFLGAGAAAGLALLISGATEASKLFLAGLHPDPTNVLLASVAAWLAYRMARAAECLGKHRTGLSKGAAVSVDNRPRDEPAATVGAWTKKGSAPDGRAGAVRFPRWAGLAGLVVTGVVAAWWLATFPVLSALLGLGFLAYGVAAWLRPGVIWVATPATLPLLDLAPWSGRFFVDEFDLVLMLSVAVGYARLAPAPARSRDWLLRLTVGVLALSWGIASLRGLLPWQAIDVNSFSHYYSPLNAIRVAKGMVWAFLMAGLTERSLAAGLPVQRYFGRGLLLGLAGTVAVVFWERWTFPGLFNFTDVYRVTGPFSQMHTGGADLECYLTVAAPFLVWALFERRGWLERGLIIMLLMATTYAVTVTFSRAAYVSCALAVALAAVFAWRRASRGRPAVWAKAGLAVAGSAGLMLAVALPVIQGGFAQARLARAGADLEVRAAHWRDALAMRDGGLVTEVFGIGLGRFPASHYWRSQETRAASYQIGGDGKDLFLRIGSGSPLYVEQFVDVQPGRDYTITLRARSAGEGGRLSVSLCEKWLLTSDHCVFEGFEIPVGEWREMTLRLPAGGLGSEPWYRRAPVKFSLSNPGMQGVVEVDDVRLAGRDGQQLLANGDFTQGMDQWFFSADVDLPWHIWSLPVAVVFEAGWVGLGAFGLVFALALARSAGRAWSGDSFSAAVLAAAIGIIVLGTVNSLGDSPRLLLLWILLLLGFACRPIFKPGPA
ncbi:MAG: VanZ family protein [Zoogloeaceae bacterium]|nr:VanZ family protein [Zoogloeaceae bacterium]